MKSAFERAFIADIDKTISRYGMITAGDHIIAGVSGGADSVCLLLVLCELKDKYELKLTPVHVNHGLRGEAADRDEQFVRRLCESLGLCCRVVRADIAAFARELGTGTEEAGHRYRYDCFKALKAELNADRIAVAHHLGDLAETVIMNALRGSDINGLSGIRPVTDDVIRPLLYKDRKDIEAFLACRGQAYCTDETNSDVAYTRNRIRHEVLPYIEKYINERGPAHLAALSVSAREMTDFVRQEAVKALAGCRREDSLDAEAFLEKHITLQREMARLMIKEKTGRLKDITQEHIGSVIELFHKETGKSIDLPYGLTVIKDAGAVRFVAGTEQSKAEYDPDKFVMTVFDYKENMIIPDQDYTKWFDYDKIKYQTIIRTYEPGDYMIADSAGHKKTLQRLFIDRKVPRDLRKDVTVIADGSHVMWVPGMRISEYYKITKVTKRVLQIEYKL